MDSTPKETLPSPDNPALHSLLLLDEDEDRGKELHDELCHKLERMLVHRVRSRSEVQRMLKEEAVDVVIVSCGAGEGAQFVGEVRHWAGRLPIIACEASVGTPSRYPVLTLSMEGDHLGVLHRLIGIMAAWQPSAPPANGTHREPARLPNYEQIRSTLLRVNHDINNPLSIVSGNAQLLLELARAMNLEEDFIQPIRDVEEASLRASQLLGRLTDLAARLAPDTVNAGRATAHHG